MAFTGTATVTSAGNRTHYITGLSLGTSAAGTIANDGVSADANLPAGAATIDQSAFVVCQGADTLIKVGYSAGVLTLTNTSGAAASGSLVIQIVIPHSATA